MITEGATGSNRAVIAGISVVLLLVLASTGCNSWLFRFLPGHGGVPARYDEQVFASKSLPTFSISNPAGKRGNPPSTVIGRMRRYRIREGDTLLDIARYHDLGYEEIVQANPAIDPWLPPEGEKIILPTAWVLPCCRFEGLVLNIPEMRLYFYYRDESTGPDTITVTTHPVGLGRSDWRTPHGRFKIRGKTTNPRWYIPGSIQRERMQELGDARRSIPGGHADNPLGKYRLELTLPSYSIHGTNSPWGIGRQVSHGCAQLYPEDIDRLFSLVEVGTEVEFTYQPVKVGTREGDLFVEAHEDIYGYGFPTIQAILKGLSDRGLKVTLDHASLGRAIDMSRGMPVRIRGGAGGGR